MKKYFLLFIAVLLLTGCASSERMMRLSPASARAYSAPDAKRLKGESFRRMPQKKVENKTLAEENVINVWPFFLKNDYFHAILWPFIDYDQYGVAVRPFYNKEGDEHSILFPLAGWNSADKSGWIANTFWSENRLTVFPLYHHKPNYVYAFPIVRETYKDNTLKSFSVIPLSMYEKYAKDGSQYVFFALPLGGWYKGKDYSAGLILNTYWGKDYLGMVPLFHYADDSWMALLAYKNDTRYGFFPLFAQNLANDGGYFFPLYMYSKSDTLSFVNVLLFFNHLRKSNNLLLNEYSKSNDLCLLFYYGKEKQFQLTKGSVNSMLFYALDTQCVNLKKAFEKSDMQGVSNCRKLIADTLKTMKIEKDFKVPENAEELTKFVKALQQRFGTVETEKNFAVVPFYLSKKNMTTDEWSLLYGLLHSSRNYRNHDLYMPGVSAKRVRPQLVEEDSTRTLMLASKSETLERQYKSDAVWYENWAWYWLHFNVSDLARSLELDEARANDKLYKSETSGLLKKINTTAATLGIKLPELKTAAQCYIYCKEIEGMALEYFRTENVSFFPFFDYEKGDKSNRFEIFPLFYTDHDRYSKHHYRDRFNLLMLCHNQTVKDKIPQGKFEKVFEELRKLEQVIHLGKGSHKLAQTLKEANLSFAVPKNLRECSELREKLYPLIPENTERISAFFPLYFYKGNDVLDDFYLNILGVFYNGGHNKKDHWFNVLGFLSRGFKEGDEEEFRILEFLYRSRKRKNEKDYLVFPFFYFRESGNSSRFSFLHRIINIEKSEKGTKGHIFYIPFGD